jgi:anti-anti-sigma factor
MPLQTQDSPRYRFGSFAVYVETGELLKNGRRVHLQRKPFEILTALLEQPGKLVARENLRQRLWPADTFVDFDNGLNTALSKLREALGDTTERPRYIETLERRGYRFIAPLEEIGAHLEPRLRELEVRRRRIEPDVVLVEIEWLTAELLEERERKIIFDLSGMRHLDSSGVGILIMCSGKVKEAEGELRVAGARGHVQTVLTMTQVGKILALYANRVDALEGFAGAAA